MEQINRWMSHNFFQLNNKIKIIMFWQQIEPTDSESNVDFLWLVAAGYIENDNDLI